MNARSLATRLRDHVRGPVRLSYPLSGLTTYRVGGHARIYFEPADVEDLDEMAEVLRDEDDVSILVLGRGSNLVVSDEGYPGLVIRPGMSFSWIRALSSTSMVAGAATPLPLLANWAARRSLAGLEFNVGIPGSVGGGVRMNAGAHGAEIVDTLRSTTVLDVAAREITEIQAAALGLSYRHSNLSDGQVILDATFELAPDGEDVVRGRMERYRKHRAETQPGALQNAGSTFKNPPGDSAGRIVDAAGLKGHRVGGAAVSELHANFFIAEDGAKAQDVYALVHEVRRLVKERTGIELEPEVRFVGAFAA